MLASEHTRRPFQAAAVLLLCFCTRCIAMDTLEGGRFSVHYSGESRQQAERLLGLLEKSYPVFKELFAADHDLRLVIYWADRKDRLGVPVCRNRSSYGMPHMTKGENHTHYVILPAANLDMPEALTRIIDPLLDMKRLSGDEVGALKRGLGLKPETTDAELRKHLSSAEFYVDYLVEIVFLHEVMHDFCYEFGLPENYGRDGRQAWWVFEGLAQWSVLWVQRQLGNENWAGIHELLYRWMYRTGRSDPGNVSPVQYANYAWFHGALVEMLCQLGARFGEQYGPRVLRLLLADTRERDFLDDGQSVAVFGKAAGADLSGWFREKWGIG
jgi:hypothetical protein